MSPWFMPRNILLADILFYQHFVRLRTRGLSQALLRDTTAPPAHQGVRIVLLLRAEFVMGRILAEIDQI